MKAANLLSSWENAQDISRANLIFENRNKNYGGYFIRVYYPDRIFRAFIFAVLGFLLLVNTPLLLEKFFGKQVSPFVTTREISIVINPILPDDNIKPPVTNYRQEQLLKETVKWVRPKVINTKTDETEIKTQEQLTVIKVDITTAKNDSATEITPDDALIISPEKTYNLYEIQEMPQFPGGEKKLMEYLLKSTHYPADALRNDIQGIVYVSFVVDKEGKISDAKATHGIGSGCDEEAIRVVRAMPMWKPGRQNGTPVSVQYNLPVHFVVGH